MNHLNSSADIQQFYSAQPFAIRLVDGMTGRIAVLCREKSGKVSGKWQLDVDGVRRSFGQFLLNGMDAGEEREFLLSVEVPDLYYGSVAVLSVRCYDENGTVIALESFEMIPSVRILPPAEKEQYFTGVRFDVSGAMISSGKLSAQIDANGMRELRYHGDKLFTGGPRLSLFRAGMVPAELKNLKLDRLKVAADRFVSDGTGVECHALALPTIMEMDELEFTQRFTPQNDGSIRYDAEFVVPESFAGIPRLGVYWYLPESVRQVTFFGNGPGENYPGEAGSVKALYTLPVAEMYPAGATGSAGCRSNVSFIKLADEANGRVWQISSGNTFSFTLLPFDEFAVEDAMFAGRGPSAASCPVLYIDCRIGNDQPVKAGVYRMTFFFRNVK